MLNAFSPCGHAKLAMGILVASVGLDTTQEYSFPPAQTPTTRGLP